MKRAIVGAGLAIALGGAAHADDDVPTFRWCVDEAMGSFRTVIVPADEAQAITMNIPDPVPPVAPLPAPEEEPDMAMEPPPPPMPAREPPLDQLLARVCPVLRIEAGDLALAHYCVTPSDKWTCAVHADGDTIVTFAP